MAKIKPTSTKRPSRPALSPERVHAMAARLADEEGLSAVTMRRVAGRLGVEAMSLYHHVRGKEELLDGVVELVAGEINETIETELADQTAADAIEWRSIVRARCLAARKVMLNHPWAPELIGSRATIPAGIYHLYEAVVGTMIRGGSSYRIAHRALHALGSMVVGFTQELFSPADAGGNLESDRAEAELAAMAEALPYTTAMVTAEVHAADDPTLGWCDSQTEFEFTLDLLLDGLAREITAEQSRH